VYLLSHPDFDYDLSALPPGIFNREPRLRLDCLVADCSYRDILKAAMLEAVG
jgi:hypothetical protein